MTWFRDSFIFLFETALLVFAFFIVFFLVDGLPGQREKTSLLCP